MVVLAAFDPTSDVTAALVGLWVLAGLAGVLWVLLVVLAKLVGDLVATLLRRRAGEHDHAAPVAVVIDLNAWRRRHNEDGPPPAKGGPSVPVARGMSEEEMQ